MALLDDVAVRLASQAVAGPSGTTTASATGWTLFKAVLPPGPDQVVAVFETGGRQNENMESGLLDRPTFQVRVRGAVNGYSAARTKIAAVRTALEGVHNTTVNGRYYAGMTADSEPFPLAVDDNNRPALVMNFAAFRSRTT
jgi:hypothetical protein